MNFAYPYFLFALFALAIPIIIHLFNFRRYKKLYFSNVSFLKEIKEETQSKSQLKHLLILICRLLAITFLVLGFAQPVIPGKNKILRSGSSAISIFIDNSFSMEASERSGTLLDEARKKAEEIVKAYQPSDKFQLLTNDFFGKQQRLLSRDEFYEELNHIAVSPSTRRIEEIIARQTDALNASAYNNKTAYIISDFQKNILQNENLKSDTSINFNLLPVFATEQNNLFIDTCYFKTPVRKLNEPDELIVRINNKGNNKIENNPLKLMIDGQQKAIASFNAEANSFVEVPLTFSNSNAGIKHAYLEITDNPVTYDDRLYFSFNINAQLKLLSINGKDAKPYVSSLFKNDKLIALTENNEDRIDYASLKSYHFIILNELKTLSSGLILELKKYLNNGGHVLILPSFRADINGYNDFLTSAGVDLFNRFDTVKQKVNFINYQHPIYSGVFEKSKKETNLDLPVADDHYVIAGHSRSNRELLLQLQNGDPFLTSSASGKGRVYTLAVSLDNSFGNFSRHAIFVPTLYQMVLNAQQVQNLYYLIGKNNFTEINENLAGDATLRLTKLKSTEEIIPEHRPAQGKTLVYFNNEINTDGNYILSLNKKEIAGLAFNYNRQESDLSYYSPGQLEEKTHSLGEKFSVINTQAQDITYTLQQLNEGVKLWKYCIIFALLFLLGEVLLIRFLK